MPAEQYHQHPALSSTGARRLLPPSTPARFRWLTEHPEAPTAEMELGTCVHTLVLGVGQRPELAPAEWRSKDDKAIVADIRARGNIPLRPGDWDTVHRMAEAVRQHPLAGPLFDPSRGVPERALFWTDPATGVQCRALVDFSPHNRRSLVDLKTTKSAAPSSLPRTVANFGYHVQGAWYLDGARRLGVADESTAFVFVFVESSPPHGVTVAQLHPDDIEQAQTRIERAREIFRDCTESGIWPGYPTGLLTVRLPPWAHRELEEDEWL